MALCFNAEFNPKHLHASAFCLGVLALYAGALPLRRAPVAAFVATMIPVVFMLVIAIDTGRWLKLGVLNAWLLAAFVCLRSAEGATMSPRAIGLGAMVVAGLLAMGPTPVNEVNRTISRFLWAGSDYRVTLARWMDGCDPQWRALVYGQ